MLRKRRYAALGVGCCIAIALALSASPGVADDNCQGHGCDLPPGGGPPPQELIANSNQLALATVPRFEPRQLQPVQPNRGVNKSRSSWTDTVAQAQPGRPILAKALADLDSYYLRAFAEILIADETGESGGKGTIEVWQQDGHYRWKAETNLGPSAIPDLDVAFGPNGYQAHQSGIVQIAQTDFRQVASPLPNPLYLMLMPFASAHDCLHPNAMTVCTMADLKGMASKGMNSAEPRPTEESDGQSVVEWFEKSEGNDRTISSIRLADFREVGNLTLPHLIHIWEYDSEDDWTSEGWRSWLTIEIEEIRFNEVLPPQSFVTAPAPGLPIHDLDKGIVVSRGTKPRGR